MRSYNSGHFKRFAPERPQLLKPVKPRSIPAKQPSAPNYKRNSSPAVKRSGAGNQAPTPAATTDVAVPRASPKLTPGGKKALRAQAHHLDPVVMIGEAGLSAGVMVEIERALLAHQLIKIRIFGDDRQQRNTIMQAITEQSGCAAVQMIGKLLVVWRPNAEKVSPRKSKVAGISRTDRAGTARLGRTDRLGGTERPGRSDRKPAGDSPPLRRPFNAPPIRVTKQKGVTANTSAKTSATATEIVRKEIRPEPPLQDTDMRDASARYVPQRPLPEPARARASGAGGSGRRSVPANSPARSPTRPRTAGGKVPSVSLLRKVTRSGH